MAVKKKINSKALLGIDRDHDDHREAAPMHSTGVLGLAFEGEQDPTNWCVEFKCDVCNQKVFEYHTEFHDLIRIALKENGIIKE